MIILTSKSNKTNASSTFSLGFHSQQRLHRSMQNKDTKSSNHPAQALTTAEVADRMGLTTRQLQDLRLRGIGPPIVQRGLSIHYELADVMDIERHEAMTSIDHGVGQ